VPLLAKHLILSKALNKAVKNGFYSFAGGAFGATEFVVLPEDQFGQIKVHVKGHPNNYWSAEAIIYNHDFARALWPWRDDSKCPYCGIAFPGSLSHPRPCPLADKFFPHLWQYHIETMVMKGDINDAIAYLGQNI
jgi:hypothetical protein